MKSISLPILSEFKAVPQKPSGWPVLRLGFRPFYLGGALVAALTVPLWVAIFMGALNWQPVVAPSMWHAHEMLFGFAVAIIVGFLMTAGKAWTGLATPRGPALGALIALWLAARVASLTGPYGVYAVLDMALLPVVAAILVRLLIQSRNYRNIPLGLILVFLGAANAAFHGAVSGMLSVPVLKPLHAGLALIIMVECVMAGRVIPAFTMAVTPGLKLVAKVWVERVTLTITAFGLVLWVFVPASPVGFFVLAMSALLQAKRMMGWHSKVTRARPILWILQAAYAWIPLGLLLLAMAQFGWVSASAGIHALAVGATGGLIIGMVTRTARGHTGRPLTVSKPEVLAYVLVMSAAVLRVLLPLAAPGFYVASLIAAATFWSLAFLIYLWVFTPWLMQTRLDGKDG